MKNPYIDKNGVDRTDEIENEFLPTLHDLQNDPKLFAFLVNDLLYYYVHGTGETPLMDLVKNHMFVKESYRKPA
jgi:hypothetical protein